MSVFTKQALILGVGGQDGSYLAEILLREGYLVHGLYRHSSVNNLWRIEHLLGNKYLQLHQGDITDIGSVHSLFIQHEFDEIYNLADQDNIRWSNVTPVQSVDVTCRAVVQLLELLSLRPSKFFQPVSSSIFAPSYERLNEGSRVCPESPYAIAKLATKNFCDYYRSRYDLPIFTGIMFNHDSPRRRGDYLLQTICKQVVEIKKGKRRNLDLYDLEKEVDIGFAGDYMEIVHRLVSGKHTPSNYCIGTGVRYTVRYIVSLLTSEASESAFALKRGHIADISYLDSTIGEYEFMPLSNLLNLIYERVWETYNG